MATFLRVSMVSMIRYTRAIYHLILSPQCPVPAVPHVSFRKHFPLAARIAFVFIPLDVNTCNFVGLARLGHLTKGTKRVEKETRLWIASN